MKKSELFIHREIAGESLLIPVGEATQQINGMIQLNEVATFIWKNIDKTASLDDLAKLVCEEYEVEFDEVREDVNKLCKDFYDRGMISEVPEFE